MTQEGVVTAVQDGRLTISICQEEACSACSAKSVCGAGKKNKQITVDVKDASRYSVGSNVKVELDRHAGKRAVLYAYVLPLLLITVSLALSIAVGASEAVAAALSLISAAVYFAALYFLRDKIKEHIRFRIVTQ